MGVPAFYRWLINKYPNVKTSVKQDRDSNSNPIRFEFDHLYLDMNGIIHPCFHPDSLVFGPTTFEEVFENVYAYIDRLFSIVGPRKLFFLAIDGVAPRAKMNQQRSRRFKTARDSELADEEDKKLREKYERQGKKLLPVLKSEVSDSNVITPGTEFMFELSNALKIYIVKRLESDPGWKDIKVVLSDATVPGEGEHKIMSFIRTLRSVPGYDPNTRHCLYGLDADLIMLALATHEIHFSILREDVLSVPDHKPNPESAIQSTIERAMASVHSMDKSTGEDKKPFNIRDKSQSSLILPQQYEFLHVWILREYLELDMQIIDPPENFVFDLERIIDDFIFMCLFVGNDFLPHMPTLEISENGIDLLMYVYKKEFKSLGGYLVDMQRVNEPHVSFIKLKRVEKFILSVGSYEDKVFNKRMVLKEKKLRWIARDFAESRKGQADEESSDVCITDAQCPKVSNCSEQHEATDSEITSISVINEMIENTKQLKVELKNRISKNSDIYKDGVVSSDKVKLGSVGWKQRYYIEKFAVEDPKEIEIQRKEIVEKYTEGLCWVLMYYFSGIPSWNWYYPYHYGLFASELKGMSQVKVKFDKGSPFLPFDQLMAVLPPKSGHALPEAYRGLMTAVDSNIVEFYPKVFEVDMDGKRFSWQGICKLPFIDQDKLLNATSQLEAKIDINEAKRNVESTDHLFWRGSNSCSNVIWDYIVPYTEKAEEIQIATHEEPIMCCNFKLPVLNLRAPRLLEGVELPEKTVFENDIMETPLWHEYMGRPFATRQPLSRSVTRVPIQQTYRNAATEESVIHKHAGTGWSGAGRGNGTNFNSSKSYNDNVPRNQQSSATSRGWFQQHPAAVSGSNRSTISSSSPSKVNRSMESLRLYPQYNHNGSFWNARNAPNSNHNPSSRPNSYAAAASNQSSTWRPISTANPRSPSLGTGRTPPFTPGGRGRGQGRSQGYYRHKSDGERSQDPNRW